MRNTLLCATLLFSMSQPLIAQLDQLTLLYNANEIVESEGSVEIKSEEEAIYSVRKRITILNEESSANFFQVSYDSETKILDLDAYIFDIKGRLIRKVKKSEIRDVAAVDGFSIYTDDRVRYVELNHSDYPYILEFSYSKRIRGIEYAAFPNWYFQDRTTSSISSSVYSVTIPDGFDIQYQLYNVDLTPEIKQGKGYKTISWTAKDIPAIKFEPFSVPWHRVVPMLRVSPARFKIDDYMGSMRSWEAYGAFLMKLYEGRDVLPEDLHPEIDRLTADAPTAREKISRLYKFMQENKRYVSVQLGIGGWQPFDASYVEERGYGDCKALSNYMMSLLDVVGIESYPVIVAASRQQPYMVEDDFVDPAFNHVILYVPEEDLWLECTSSNNPPGYLGRYCNDRRVLLVTPTGGELKRTPKLSVFDNLTQENVQITLTADGAASLEYEANMQGIPHETWRNASFYKSQEELENKVREKGNLPNLSIGTVRVENNDQLPESILQFSATATRYASRAGKRLFVPLNLTCPQTEAPASVEERNFPVLPPYGYSQESNIVFSLPEGYKLESLPKPIALETPYGKYHLTPRQEGDQVLLERSLVVYDNEQPAEAYNDFREFFLAVVKADASKMVLVAE